MVSDKLEYKKHVITTAGVVKEDSKEAKVKCLKCQWHWTVTVVFVNLPEFFTFKLSDIDFECPDEIPESDPSIVDTRELVRVKR